MSSRSCSISKGVQCARPLGAVRVAVAAFVVFVALSLERVAGSVAAVGVGVAIVRVAGAVTARPQKLAEALRNRAFEAPFPRNIIRRPPTGMVAAVAVTAVRIAGAVGAVRVAGAVAEIAAFLKAGTVAVVRSTPE